MAIRLSVATPLLVVGRSDAIAATPLDDAGRPISGLAPTWSVDHPAVLVVDARGRVTAVGVGEATVTARIGGKTGSARFDVAPDTVPFLRKPFAGDFRVVNPLDHELPLGVSGDGNLVQVDWLGETASFENAHDGWDWALPLGTPVLAAADGRVNFAGPEVPFHCPLLPGDPLVSGLEVHIVHRAPTGELFATVYLHLERIDVAVGDSVTAGRQLGLSGSTGCSTGPHLHFGVGRQLFTRDGSRRGETTDPFGWAGHQDDPWLLEPAGVASSYLWKPGEAPSGVLDRGVAVRSLPGAPAGAAPTAWTAPAGSSRILDLEPALEPARPLLQICPTADRPPCPGLPRASNPARASP